MEPFAIGQIFDDTYTPEAALWCNENHAYIEEIDTTVDGIRRFQIVAIPAPTLDDIKSAKMVEINAAYNDATSSLVNTYPATELLTFDKQEQEARAYVADPSASTPFLSGLAKARGITLDDLVWRVIAKSEAFASAVATLTGQRQRYEDLLDAATTAEEVAAIVPEYKLPEA